MFLSEEGPTLETLVYYPYRQYTNLFIFRFVEHYLYVAHYTLYTYIYIYIYILYTLYTYIYIYYIHIYIYIFIYILIAFASVAIA